MWIKVDDHLVNSDNRVCLKCGQRMQMGEYVKKFAQTCRTRQQKVSDEVIRRIWKWRQMDEQAG